MSSASGELSTKHSASARSSGARGGNQPDGRDVELAVRAIRVHRPVMQYPETKRCRNCSWPHPCVSHTWGRTVLAEAGWSEDAIAALDQRSGAWA